MKQLAKFKPSRKTYPWKRWANGRPWRVEHGKDFECEASKFRYRIYGWARRNDRKVRVSVKGDAVEFQFGKARKIRAATN